MTMRLPSLFLVGAPKCGTTSLAAWLGAHPGVFMSTPKEPGFFAPDVASSRRAHTLHDYGALFRRAGETQVLAEASTSYLRSRIAVARILTAVPGARFVVCLRNPIDMAPSVHGQLLRTGREPIADFETAWNLQAARKRAPTPRRDDHNPADLQYAEMCRLGAQVEAFLAVAPRARVRFVFLDDLKADPAAIYRETLAFAGLPDDGRRDFPVFNARRTPRSPRFAQASRRASATLRLLGIGAGTGLGTMLNRWNETPVDPAAAAPGPRLARLLRDTFHDDILRLARATGCNLDHWLEEQRAT
jgi:hypothetical protein